MCACCRPELALRQAVAILEPAPREKGEHPLCPPLPQANNRAFASANPGVTRPPGTHGALVHRCLTKLCPRSLRPGSSGTVTGKVFVHQPHGMKKEAWEGSGSDVSFLNIQKRCSARVAGGWRGARLAAQRALPRGLIAAHWRWVLRRSPGCRQAR